MKKGIVFFLFLHFLCISGFSQVIIPGTRSNRGTGTYHDMTSWDSSPYEEYTFDNQVDSLGWINFRMLKPLNYSAAPAEKYPLILFFHGAGEAARRNVNNTYDPSDLKYDNNDFQLYHGGKEHLDARNNGKFPGFVLFPQNDFSWGASGEGSEPLTKDIATALRLVETLIAQYPIDPFRIYVHGLSNGGIATWTSLYKRPDLITAAAPMSAKGDTSQTSIIGSTPVWAFQGGTDTNPSEGLSTSIINYMSSKGANVRYTIYPTLGHRTWDAAYAEPDFFSWFLSKRKNDIFVWGRDTTLCPGASLRLSVSAGLDQYEWSNGDTTNEISVSGPGQYRVRIRRGIYWSDWSKPVNITWGTFTTPPVINSSNSLYLPSISGGTAIFSTTIKYAKYLWTSPGASNVTTATLSVSAAKTYSLLVQETGKCMSTVPSNITIINAKAVGRPTTPAGLSGVPLSELSTKLTWTDNNTNEVGYEIYRSTVATSGFKFIATVPSNTVTYTDMTGLSPITTYYYKVRSINLVGASDATLATTIKTLADVTPPTIPGNLVVTAGYTIRLNWTASTDNVKLNRYFIFRNGVLIDSTLSLSYTALNLVGGQRYTFVVKAKDTSKNYSASSNQASAVSTLAGVDYSFYKGNWTALPDFSTLTPFKTGHQANFSLSPKTVSDQFAFKFQTYLRITKAGTYTFYTNSDDGSKLYIGGFAESNLVVNNDGLHGPQDASGTKYLAIGYYPLYVTYFEGASGESLTVQYAATSIGISKKTIPNSEFFRSNGVPVLPALPSMPTSIQVQLTPKVKQVVSTWVLPTVGSRTEVFRSLTASSGFVFLKTVGVDSTIYRDNNVEEGKTYYYQFKSINSNGESALSSVYSITVPSFPLPASNLKLDSIANGNVNLSWIDNSYNEAGFVIRRKEKSGSFSDVGTVSANALSYSDTQVVVGRTYVYQVVSVNSLGIGSPSDSLVINIPLPTIAYQGDWKMAALEVSDSYSQAELENALANKLDYFSTTAITPGSTRTITMKLPAMPEGGMMIYNLENGVATSTVKQFVSANSTNGVDGTWTEVTGNYLTNRDDDLQKIDFAVSTSEKWYKAEFANNGIADVKLKEVGLYAFVPGVRHNYILLLGASLEETAGGYTDFKNEIEAQFPGTQPVLFNLSKSGTNAGALYAELQSILDKHPKAGYVMIHQGGNNITPNRPLTLEKATSSAVANEFALTIKNTILKCQEQGKVTVHARISYRDYRTDPKVNAGKNQEFGSLPYNLLMDSIFKNVTPEFYDNVERRPRMDLYEATLNDQSIISGDGIHPAGAEKGLRLVRKWVNSPIRYFYTGTFPDPIPYTEYVPNLADSAERAVIKAEISKSAQDVFVARIIVEQLSNTSIRVPLHVRLDVVQSGAFVQAPSAPTSVLSEVVGKNTVNLEWTDVSDESYYILKRSANDTSNFQNVNAFIKTNTTSFSDSDLLPHTNYFYKLQAGNVGGLSLPTYFSATTMNTIPVLNEIGEMFVIQGLNYEIPIVVSDSDNDAISATLTNAPDFLTVSSNKLILNPTTSNTGLYSNIGLKVNDGFGGTDSIVFSVNVLNSNAVPVINSQSNVTVNELDSLSFTLSATDLDNDSLTWSVDNGPAFATYDHQAGGKLKVTLHPTLSSSGNYTLYTSVKDSKNAIVKDTLSITVVDLVPTVMYRVNAGSTAVTASPMNWSTDNTATPSSYFDLAYSGNYAGGASGFLGQNTTSAPSSVFAKYRLDYTNTKGQIRYKFPVSGAKLIVNLFFAESPSSYAVTAAGLRVFSIKIENNTVLSNLDIYAEAAANALQKQFMVSTQDGVLEIELVRNIGRPIINGLEIIQLLPAGGSSNREGDFEISSNESAGLVESEINVSPNPVSDVAYLTGLPTNLEGNAAITITNEIGVRVYENQVSFSGVKSTLELPFNGLAAGFYIVKVELPNTSPIIKTVIKR